MSTLNKRKIETSNAVDRLQVDQSRASESEEQREIKKLVNGFMSQSIAAIELEEHRVVRVEADI